MRLSFHSARRCACGAGCHLGTSDPLEAFVRLVATRAPARVIEVERVEDLDAMEVLGAQLAPVRCHACGAIGTPTHVVIAEGGRPVGADTIATMLSHGAREDERTRNLRAALPPLESYVVPDALGPAAMVVETTTERRCSVDHLETAGGARRALGLTQRQLDHLLAKRPDLEPPKLSGRRVFNRESIDALRVALVIEREGFQTAKKGDRP